MKILSYRRFALWWQLAMDWFQRQFADIAASIDFTPVEEKLDEVKGDVADVKTAVENIDIDTSDLAKEATLGTSSDTSVSTTIFGWLKSIRDFLVGIVTTNPYAKEASVKDGNDTAISVAKDVRSEVGTSSDTAAETGTLAAVLKWVKNKVKDIYTALTDSTNGLAAIKTEAEAAKTAAQGITIPTDYAKAGTPASGTAPTMVDLGTAIAAIPTTTPSGWATPTNVSDAQAAIIAAIQANAGVPTLTIPDSTAAQELAPNTLYIFATRTSTLTLTLGTPIVGIANEYHFFVVCGSTAPTINFPAGITWNGGSAPTIAADKTYEVSILNNVAAYFEV